MNTVAWVLQIFLAVVFLLHGLVYTVAYRAVAKRRDRGGQAVSPLPPALRQFIGVAELAAAFGLTVPPAVHFLPWLAPLAAAGLVLVMVGAAIIMPGGASSRRLHLRWSSAGWQLSPSSCAGRWCRCEQTRLLDIAI